ncbi:hypothetical protein ACGFYU_11915 [Streptomyces sp. NPDC048337]|uniref:hypothetical protein n=1 Tax=Streptomyces sp. NPDC048337 TaxID=3365535 RepID=UPI0037216DF6
MIQARLAGTAQMLAEWGEGAAGPLERVRRFIEIVITNQGDIENYGCPVGTLTSELAKLGHPSRTHAVGVFEVFRAWLRGQFEELGRAADADDPRHACPDLQPGRRDAVERIPRPCLRTPRGRPAPHLADRAVLHVLIMHLPLRAAPVHFTGIRQGD